MYQDVIQGNSVACVEDKPVSYTHLANSDKEESLRLAEQAKRYLTERGQVCVVRGQEQEHGNAHCELPSGNVDGILVPVSYTHLDVYKRQV